MTQGELIARNWKPGDYLTPKILADWNDEQGFHRSAAMLRKGIGLVNGYGDGGGYGGGGDGDGGYGDGGYGGYGGYGGGGGYGYGDGGYGGYGGDGGGFTLSKGFHMENGLCIICCPGGYYPYVRIGWAVRQDDFIWLYNCRVIKRFGTDAELADIAVNGPKSNTQLLKAATRESVSAAMVSRFIEADPEAWAKECPEPKGYAKAVEA